MIGPASLGIPAVAEGDPRSALAGETSAFALRLAAASDRAQAAWAAWRAEDCREVTGYDWRGGSGAASRSAPA